MERSRFSLRTLLAVMAGCSFVAFVLQWVISHGAGAQGACLRSLLIVTPWAIGSFVGFYLAARRNRSTLLGAICGGVIANLLCPGAIIFYLYLNQMNGVRSLNGMWMQLAFAVCGSGLLAAVVDILRTGLRLRHARNETEHAK